MRLLLLVGLMFQSWPTMHNCMLAAQLLLLLLLRLSWSRITELSNVQLTVVWQRN
jgi:hypothetical protein